MTSSRRTSAAKCATAGLCMVIDIVEERGFSDIDLKWGDPMICHFPLIHGMKPPRLPWTIALYTLMWIGAGGVMIGFCFKLACGCFLLPYWYFFTLDKMNWNNHSYLYGVVSILFWGTGASNYLLLLTTEQIDFLIVHWFGFIFDLTVGFWMLFDKTRLPAMVFCTSFHLMNSRLFHIGMFPYVCLATMPLFCHVDWPRRIEAWFYSSRLESSFSDDEVQENLKNEYANGIDEKPQESCSEKLVEMKNYEDPCEQNVRKTDDEGESNFDETGACPRQHDTWEQNSTTEGNKDQDRSDQTSIERKLDLRQSVREMVSSDSKYIAKSRKKSYNESSVTKKQKTVVALLLFHVFMQLFLPYSHFITKGYNNWVPGLYGYSWDMMVHSWDTILVVIKIHDNVQNEDHYLDPQAWVQGDRWSKHGDMVRQYAHCLKDNLMLQRQKARASGRQPSETEHWARLSTNLSIYIDVWCSLNGRFLQRVFDPRVDLLTADWHPFQPVSYLMPLMTQFSSYRNRLDEIQRDVYAWSNYTDVLFVADYPGMQLENYIDEDLSNVTLTVLEGQVIYREDSWQQGVTVAKGNSLEVSPGEFHNVQTISYNPACLMYTFTNGTKQKLEARGEIIPPLKPKDAFPIFKEIKYRFNAWKRTLGHIADAFFYLAYDVPMLRRIRIN